MKIKDLKQGELFTLKEIAEPFDYHVWVRGYYDRSEKAYICHNFGDVNKFRSFKADRNVFTAFMF